jgi:hypothetical protein
VLTLAQERGNKSFYQSPVLWALEIPMELPDSLGVTISGCPADKVFDAIIFDND